MAAKIIAKLIITGATVLSKAFVTAYHQALNNAKTGGASIPNSAHSTVSRSKNKIHVTEALKILDIEKGSLSKSVLQEKYGKMFAINDPKKGGSFYLQSKVFRAHQVLEEELANSNSAERS